MSYQFKLTQNKNITKLLTATVNDTLADSVAEKWTTDTAGACGSLEKFQKALDAFFLYHPEKSSKRFGLKHFDAISTRKVFAAISKKRGRVSSYDVQILRTVIQINRTAGRSTDSHMALLASLSKKVKTVKKSDLAANAEKYREEILEYCQSKSTKAPALKFTESRDKFIFALLLHVPIRLNSLHLIERNWIKDGVIYLPADAVKNRKEINIDLPALVLRKLNDYLALRTDNNQKLLVSYQGHPILKKSLYRTVYRRTEKAAGVRLGPHAFRSIVATWASKLIGSEFAADILVISPSVLRKHYYMSDETDKLRNALAKLRGV